MLKANSNRVALKKCEENLKLLDTLTENHEIIARKIHKYFVDIHSFNTL